MADMTRLPLQDGTTSCLVAMDSMEHLPDLGSVKREIIRVGNEDATLIVSGPTETHSIVSVGGSRGFSGDYQERTIDDIDTSFRANGWTLTDSAAIRLIPLFKIYSYSAP
jgi:hypothetical protein